MDDLPPVGARVVVRYRLPEGYAQPLTDVIGELLDTDPVTVRTTAGEVVAVQPDQVYAMKALGPRPIRTADIRALESAAADAWPGSEHDWIDGWLVRAGYGYTNRANSAVPLGNPGGIATTAASTVDAIAGWYTERDLTPTLVLPDRMVPIPPGWRTYGETQVLAVDLDTVVLPEGPSIVPVDTVPTRSWVDVFAGYDPRVDKSAATLEVLSAVRNGLLGFASLGGIPPLAIARGAVTDAPGGRRWVGLSGVHVAPAHRRNGLGTLIGAEVLRWARTHGATHAYAQVAVDNAGALDMYRALGFVEHHRYRYTMPPGANT
ncbi:MAG: GNAT family N-acetyltransferase [Mycobacteriaceae bacterium]|nr:GNAT family N-acetyltransferase [Mycobacteriaceae bacterium]